MNKNRKTGTRIAAIAEAVVLGCTGLAAIRHAGPPQKDMTVDKAVRSEVVASIIANLNQSCVFPENAAVIGKSLRPQLHHGDFDSITSAETWVNTLTKALRRDSDDKHLEVRSFEHAISAGDGQSDSAENNAAELAEGKHFNFGVYGVDRLRGDIGYIDLHQFGRPWSPTHCRHHGPDQRYQFPDHRLARLRRRRSGNRDAVRQPFVRQADPP